MRATIKYVNPAKEGKKFGTIVTTSGEKFVLPKDINMTPGEYDLSIEDQKWGTSMVKVVISVNKPQPTQIEKSTDRWYMPFVSNVVAHAIASGNISQPSQIEVWAVAAHGAALNLGMKIEDLENDIPGFE